MRELPLTNGGVALIDEVDYDKCVKFNWWSDGKYAVRALPREGRKNSPLQLLHIFLLGTKPGLELDHKNRNGLDCRRENLRFVTHSFNLANRVKPSKSTYSSKFKGVSWHKQKSRWRAYITQNGRQNSLGLHDTEESAARAYDRRAVEFFGESACLNLPK